MHRFIFIFVSGIFLCSSTACSRITFNSSSDNGLEEEYQGIVIASYYSCSGAELSLRTANGELFNPNALTAAHPSYPFGTILKVTNPLNSRTVYVRINDRGPYIKGRSLDLSARAAQELGIHIAGVAPVEVAILKEKYTEQ